ncbi:carbon monoxide dehydrogenase subunit G [Streptomyces sp. SID8366]|uniref:SRPBCC family protein n=1 Tax=unclassified Streptomyces TaxID=2593676 RepID=UPI000DB9CC44|nr:MULTISPECIES: SRPBCC family protein [Streptomyces]MYU07519.1 carbon monoxide dehydrogenase subunit G [Streptomyces sp. SID8366]MYU65184.1 carbon monoxide dehydrogenase subunit G [Streptomyces sp. SID69]RAJ60224.1 carbon monoxide dehydrogenase subunit G [Streptomyces sp. PsTaAH-130]TXJ81767.1 carbon monoxide dehydrogenase subunit G [Streptomyces lavendulae]
MEHQVFVPAPADRLATALADPARVARAVPGLQQDAGAPPVAGRLKLRVGGHSVTYRGTARVLARQDGTYTVEGDATEARGTGAVKLALTLRLADAEGGTTVTAEGGADASGRIAELPAETVAAAATRLLTRFLEALGEPAEEPGKDAEAPAAGHASVFDTEIPPSSLGPDADDADDAQESAAGAQGPGDDVEGPADDFTDTGVPPAEAAHARRTMIGRSAEEVDHAPPRGRYAPVPAPQAVSANQALKWAAPAAALAVASAIVVGRALRRRR